MADLLVPIRSLAEATVRSPREGFGSAMLALGRANPDIYALCADLTESVQLSAFAKVLPDQFIEVGVAEQNMVGVAAGLALSGKIPFAVSYAAFNPGRTWDQLRVSIAYSNANVKLIGSHAGLTVGPDGATHQALEDIAITRVLPNLAVVAPVDATETAKAVQAAASFRGPVYIRFGRAAIPDLTLPETPFTLGVAYRVREGHDVTVCVNGCLFAVALAAAEQLTGEISCEVIAVPTVKPLDVETVLASARRTGCVVTAEDAQVAGGLGGAIAELLGEQAPMPFHRVGVHDRFGQSGTSEELAGTYGTDLSTLVQAIRSVTGRPHSVV